MAVVTGSILRLTGRMFWKESVVMVATHYATLSGANEDDSDAVFVTTGWMDAMYQEISNVLTSDMDFIDIIVDQLSPTQRHLDTVPWPGLTSGGSASEALPSGVAALVSFSTAVIKRRGRKYIGGLTEGVLNDGVLATAFIADLTAYAGVAITPFAGQAVGAIWTPIIYSVLGEEGSAITAAVVRSVPAYQRRRRPGVGI